MKPVSQRNESNFCIKHEEAFLLRDEIGLCSNMEDKFELNDKTPFYITPVLVRLLASNVIMLM